MKILLLKTIDKVGQKGNIVDVSDGYAKNVLIAKKAGVAATAMHIKEFEQRKQKESTLRETRLRAIKELVPELHTHIFEFKVRTGKNNEVFTSVHQEEIQKTIAEFLSSREKILGIEDVHLENKPIKELGEHAIEVRLGRGEETSKTTIIIKIQGE